MENWQSEFAWTTPGKHYIMRYSLTRDEWVPAPYGSFDTMKEAKDEMRRCIQDDRRRILVVVRGDVNSSRRKATANSN